MHQFLDLLIEVMLGIGLSAAAGFRVFVPLLAVSIAAVLGHIDLPANLDWAETPEALVVFAIACFLEISGYYIPWFDHLLDIVATPAAIITGTIVTASLAPEMDPIAKWALALIAGGGTAGLMKSLMNILRIGSTASSGGLTNPILSTLELVAAIALSVFAITLPVVAGVVVLGMFAIALQKIWQFFAKRQTLQN